MYHVLRSKFKSLADNVAHNTAHAPLIYLYYVSALPVRSTIFVLSTYFVLFQTD